ncbi:MAG TPA: hypothetical protein VKE42_05800 [Candidatus Cybelea sp.]|nr:hypothetical protein [Candidatus Cybelea sp.]
MSRSGYSDDYDTPIELYRQAVENAILGKRGQALLRRLRDALDAMPVKRLITDAIKDEHGDVCALGALDPTAPNPIYDDYEAPEKLAKHFNIAPALAAEIVYMNDEYDDWRTPDETPEQRWTRMREWVRKQIGPDDADVVEGA